MAYYAERSSTIRGEFLPELLKSGHPLNPFKGGAQTEEQVCVPLSGIPSSLSGNQLFSQFASLAATVGNDYSSTSESGHLPYMLRTLDIGVVSMCLKTIGIGSSFLVSAFLDHTFFPGTNRLVLKRRIPLTKCDHTEDKRIIASMMLELRVLTHTPVRKHENIVQLLGVGWETDALELQPRTGAALSESLRKWPVMLIERADKGTLAGFLRETATELPYRLKKTLCLDILLGLEVLHYCGIIHGDVKLTNVLMFSNPNAETREIRPYIAKLADFGGAVCDLKSPARLPSGTRPWNAPEWQQNIRPENAPNSDIYSLGFAILQVMVDGRNPFRDFHFDEVRTETYLKEGSALNSFEDDIDLWKKDDLKLLPYLKSLLSLKADINKTELALILDATIRVNPRERNLEGPKALLLAEEAQFRAQADFGGLLRRQCQLREQTLQFTFGGIWDVNPAVLRYMTKELLRAAHDFNMYDIESSTASAAEAQYGLAVMYINGMVDCERYNESLYSDCGVQTNAPEDADPVRHQFRSGIDEGLSWLRAAANLNHVRAQAIVHRVHKVFGRSLPVEDQFRVPGWLYLAVTKGYFTAAEDLFELSTEDLYDYGMITLRFQKSGVGKQLFDDDHFPSDTNPKFGIFTQSGREKFDRELKEKLEAVASVPAYCRSIFNHKGDTMLHYTATCGWQQTLSKLVASDPDSINTKNVNGEIPLLQACRSGHRDIVLFLLEHGADPKIASEDGNTPLHWLHRFETEDIEPIGRALVARGGNLDAVASGFSYTDCAENAWVQGTPLEWAILRNCLHAVEVLLGLGADVSPAISLAARLQYPEILNLLFSKPPTASRTVDRYGYSLLALAISGGSIQVPCGSLLGRIRRHGVLWRERAQQTIKLLLKQGDAIDLGDLPPHKGLTALLCGVLFAEVDVVAFLLQIGCDEHLNTLSPVPSDHEQYLTPLGCALHSRNFETFRLLLKHKADVTISHSNHPNLLYACAALNIDDRRYAQALIDAGLGIDDVPSGYETALGCAVRSRCFELADLLLERGADINNEYSEGLFFADAKPKTVLGYLVLEHSTNSIIICIDFLFNHPRAQPGFVVSRKTNFTVLHAAASIPQEEQDQRVTEIVLHRLMEYFKPTQAQLDMALNKDRYTALHLACLNFNTEAVRILLEFGADATLQNAYGEAPLDIARTSLITFPEFFSFRDEMKGKERQLTEGKARVEEIVSRLERSQEKSSGGRDCPKMEAS